MKKLLGITLIGPIAATAIVVVALVLLMAAPAVAVTGDFVADFDHPFVGLVVVYDVQGNFLWRGSGSLISPIKFLTAGHVVDTAEGAYSARVYFEQDAGAHYDPTTGVDPISGYPVSDGHVGHALYNYGFSNFAGFPNTRDVGLVILDTPVEMEEYGELPEAGELDQYATARGRNKAMFTVSGYGLTYAVQSHSALSNISFRSRLMAQSSLVNLTSALTAGYNLQTQGNGNGRGGTLFGDSGGPVFLGGPDSNLIVGVTSFVMNSLGRGTNFAYRVDTSDVLGWINGGYLGE